MSTNTISTPWYTLAIWNISIPHLLLLRFDKVSTKWVVWVNRVLRTPWFSGTAHGGFHHRNQLRSRRAQSPASPAAGFVFFVSLRGCSICHSKKESQFRQDALRERWRNGECENFYGIARDKPLVDQRKFPRSHRRMPLVWFDQLVKLNTAITDRPPW